MAIHYRQPDQGEGYSHAKAIMSYIIPCSLRACKFLVVTASDMTTETRVISIVLSLNKAHILKATTVSSFKRHGRFLNNSRDFFILYILLGLKFEDSFLFCFLISQAYDLLYCHEFNKVMLEIN